MADNIDYAKLHAAQTRSPHHIQFSGLDVIQPDAVQVRFEIGHDDDEDARAELSIIVEGGNAGADDLIARGYDKVIEALQQMLWEAATQREGYRRSRSGRS